MRINHLHESILLFTISAVAAIAVYFVDPLQRSRQATLIVEEMCCDLRAGNAAKELRKVAGVAATKQSVVNREIQITILGDASVLHASLWNAASKAHVRPVKLIVDGRVIAQRND